MPHSPTAVPVAAAMVQAAAVAAAVSAADTPGEDQALQQFLCFAIGGARHAARIDAVREILEVARITPLPGMPPCLRGVMNLRGAVVPVVDLGQRLGLAAATLGQRSCVVIVDVALADAAGHQRLGMLVDAVYEVVEVPAAELEPVPRLGTDIAPEHLRSMVRVRGQATPELDLAKVLDPGVLAELVAGHAQHLAQPHDPHA